MSIPLSQYNAGKPSEMPTPSVLHVVEVPCETCDGQVRHLV